MNLTRPYAKFVLTQLGLYKWALNLELSIEKILVRLNVGCSTAKNKIIALMLTESGQKSTAISPTAQRPVSHVNFNLVQMQIQVRLTICN